MNILLGIDQLIQLKILLWEQKIEVRLLILEKPTKVLMSKIQGASFEKNPTTGVGGPCNLFFS